MMTGDGVCVERDGVVAWLEGDRRGHSGAVVLLEELASEKRGLGVRLASNVTGFVIKILPSWEK